MPKRNEKLAIDIVMELQLLINKYGNNLAVEVRNSAGDYDFVQDIRLSSSAKEPLVQLDTHKQD